MVLIIISPYGAWLYQSQLWRVALLKGFLLFLNYFTSYIYVRVRELQILKRLTDIEVPIDKKIPALVLIEKGTSKWCYFFTNRIETTHSLMIIVFRIFFILMGIYLYSQPS